MRPVLQFHLAGDRQRLCALRALVRPHDQWRIVGAKLPVAPDGGLVNVNDGLHAFTGSSSSGSVTVISTATSVSRFRFAYPAARFNASANASTLSGSNEID